MVQLIHQQGIVAGIHIGHIGRISAVPTLRCHRAPQGTEHHIGDGTITRCGCFLVRVAHTRRKQAADAGHEHDSPQKTFLHTIQYAFNVQKYALFTYYPRF